MQVERPWHEIVVRFEPGKRHAVRIELTPPGSPVMKPIDELVELEPIAGGTRLVRRFTATPRSFLTAPLASLFGGVLLRRAADAHNAAVAASLPGEGR